MCSESVQFNLHRVLLHVSYVVIALPGQLSLHVLPVIHITISREENTPRRLDTLEEGLRHLIPPYCRLGSWNSDLALLQQDVLELSDKVGLLLDVLHQQVELHLIN